MLVAALGVVVVIAVRLGPSAVREFTLPLKHEDIIRQQAADKKLDPALIAAVIYQESKFRDRTSSAGAKGLMQILPSTAEFIANKSGGTQFELRDLGTPQVNIAYGSWYLRYLIDHYNGNETLGGGGLQRRHGQRRPLGQARGRAGQLRRRPEHPVPGDEALRAQRDVAPGPVPAALREAARARVIFTASFA